jgi:hypothetical protein
MTTHPLPREAFAVPRIAAISDADQRRPIAVVLGMHRSGTSLCAHILSAMGIDMADEITAAPSNARGHWERWEIVEFHDRILRLLNRDYFGPLHDLPLPPAWWADPRVSQIKRTGKNGRHRLAGLLRQSVFGRLAGYEDVNDAERLCRDPAIRWVVDDRAIAGSAASASQMGRFETNRLCRSENLATLVDLPGQ